MANGKPLSHALQAALSAAQSYGFSQAMAHIAAGGPHEDETAQVMRQADAERDEALRRLARQLADDGFRP